MVEAGDIGGGEGRIEENQMDLFYTVLRIGAADFSTDKTFKVIHVVKEFDIMVFIRES